MLSNEPVGNGHIEPALMAALTGVFNGQSGNGRDQREAGMVARLKMVCCGRNASLVGALTHTHPETTRRYLSGKSTPHPLFLAALCDALWISEAWLLSGRGSPYRGTEPTGDHITPREAAIAVRASLKELEGRLAELEKMLEYPSPGRRPGVSGFLEAAGSYEAGTTSEATSGAGTTRPVRALRLRQRG